MKRITLLFGFAWMGIAAAAGAADSSAKPDPTQVARAMHTAMKDHARVTVGVRAGDITGADHRALQAAVDYVASLGDGDSLRGRVVAGMRAITVHEGGLTRLFLEGIAGIDGLTLYGIADADRWNERTPTFAIRIDAMTPRELAEELARRGIFVWDGNYYALSIMERLGLEESGGAARIGFCHYNTPNEVDRVVADLADVAAKR